MYLKVHEALRISSEEHRRGDRHWPSHYRSGRCYNSQGEGLIEDEGWSKEEFSEKVVIKLMAH